jgi:hypothetical protein
MKTKVLGFVSDTRQNVHQKVIFFNGGYWTDWFKEVDKQVFDLLNRGFGVLDVKFEKTNPENSILAYVLITYWDHP